MSKLKEKILELWDATKELLLLVGTLFLFVYFIIEVFIESNINIICKIILGLTLIILGTITYNIYDERKKYYIIKILESPFEGYASDKINDIKKSHHMRDEDIVKSSINLYHREITKTIETDKNFLDFDTLYEAFINSDYIDKKILLSEIPLKYQSKILKAIIEDTSQ